MVVRLLLCLCNCLCELWCGTVWCACVHLMCLYGSFVMYCGVLSDLFVCWFYVCGCFEVRRVLVYFVCEFLCDGVRFVKVFVVLVCLRVWLCCCCGFDAFVCRVCALLCDVAGVARWCLCDYMCLCVLNWMCVLVVIYCVLLFVCGCVVVVLCVCVLWL